MGAATAMCARLARDSRLSTFNLTQGLSTLHDVLRKIETADIVVGGVVSLNSNISKFSEEIERLVSSCDGPWPEEVQRRMDVLMGTWIDMASDTRPKSLLSFFSRKVDPKKMRALVDKLNSSFDVYFVSEVKQLEIKSENLYSKKQTIGSLRAIQAKSAQYNANGVRYSCAEGTRTDTLGRLQGWIKTAQKGATDEPGGNICRISGAKGAGKTIVAHTIVEWCLKEHIFTASFFCSRSDANCSDHTLIFTTISRQLCSVHAPFKEKAAALLAANPDILDYTLDDQFKILILNPLERLKEPLPMSAIVVDALNECSDPTRASTIPSVVAKYSRRTAHSLLFIFTFLTEQTTPEDPRENDRNSFPPRIYLTPIVDKAPAHSSQAPRLGAADSTTQSLEAREPEGQTIGTLPDELPMLIRDTIDPTPSRDRLLRVQGSGSAPDDALYSRYSVILTKSSNNPEATQALRSVLRVIALARGPLSATAIADIQGLQESDVLDALSGLQSDLRIPTDPLNDALVDVIHPSFRDFLLHYLSVHAPQLPSTSHQSWPTKQQSLLFCWCLLSMRRSPQVQHDPRRDPGFTQKVLETSPHVHYACLHWGEHMFEGSRCLVSTQVRDGETQVSAYDLFSEFVAESLPFWLEACSLPDILATAVNTLEFARKACQNLDRFADMVPHLVNFRRLVLMYSPRIHENPLHIYHFALTLAPRLGNNCTEKIASEVKSKPAMTADLLAEWPPCVDILQGNDGARVRSVAFSPGGGFFVTGGGSGGNENYIRTWDATTRTASTSGMGVPKAQIYCLVFSPDGRHLVSASDDQKVCVWEMTSRKCVSDFRLEHPTKVCAVVYTSDGQHIITTTSGGEAKIWDPEFGHCLFTTTVQEGAQHTAISPNKMFISCIVQASLHLYDISRHPNRHLKTLKLPGDGVLSVFSPNSRYIAAATTAQVVVWSLTGEGEPYVQWQDAVEQSSVLVFSHDNTHIGIGCVDGSVRLRRVESRSLECTLIGHTGRVNGLAWNPNGLQIVSVGDDGDIRLWDTSCRSESPAQQPADSLPSIPQALVPDRPAEPVPTDSDFTPGRHDIVILQGEAFTFMKSYPESNVEADGAMRHAFDVTNLTYHHAWDCLTNQRLVTTGKFTPKFSLDGTRMAYTSQRLNRTDIHIHDLCGSGVVTRVENVPGVLSACFSADFRLLATCSSDRVVRIWVLQVDPATKMVEHGEHSDWVTTVAFAPSASLVASGSVDRTVRVFDFSRKEIRWTATHEASVENVTFSSNGKHVISQDIWTNIRIWRAETGDQIYELQAGNETWFQSLTFAPDGTGIVGTTGKTISLWNKARTWPIYYITRDGWVYAKSPRQEKRVFWLPPQWRQIWCSDGSFCYILDGSNQRPRVIRLDMSDYRIRM